ncbi:sensor histidine kinase YycG [archaeon BMS3Abin16]|nr:sensor histidine kinase YycG [archaeon BMS3Abin16]
MIVDALDEGSFWRVSVADSGNGILDVDKDLIFNRFKRIDKGGVQGTGLGLAIVKKIVEAHGGRVWVEDNHAIGGSVFFFTVPK